jgi:hypothetical protein
MSPAVAWLAAFAALAAPPPRAHPADGPDIDVRIVIGPSKVSLTMLMNLAFIEEIVSTSREDEEAIHPAEYEAHQLDLLEWFRTTNKVAIDGVQIEPVAREFEVQEADLSLLPLFPRAGAKALVKVRLLLDYPAKTPPREVALTWGRFPPDRALETELGIPPITVVAMLTAKGLRSRIVLTESEPEWVWHDTGESLADRFEAVPDLLERATLEIPIWTVLLCGLGASLGVLGLRFGGWRRRPWLPLAAAALVLGGALAQGAGRLQVPSPFGGARLPDAAQAIAIFQPLHANIYRAFDYVAEGEIYDALARSVEGNLLDATYNEIYQSLIMQEEGGAVSEVQAVRPLETDVERIGPLDDGRPGITVRSRWQVEGAVFHWGHSHHRTNEYEARYVIAHGDNGWRIRGQEILAQRLVAAASTDPRGR